MSSISTLIEASSSAAVLLGFFMVLPTHPRNIKFVARLIGLTLSLADLRDTGVFYGVADDVKPWSLVDVLSAN